MKKNLLAIIAVIVSIAAFIVAGVSVNGSSAPRVGGVTNLDALELNDGLMVTASSTRLAGTTTLSALVANGDSNLATLIFGGSVESVSSTTPSYPLSASQVCDNSVFTFTPLGGNATVTMPTAAQLIADCLATTGDGKFLLIKNGATAATSTGIAASSSIVLLQAGGSIPTMTQNNWAKIFLRNVDGTNIVAEVTRLSDAD